MLPLGMTEQDYSLLLHRYVDRLDALLRANEFVDAEKTLRELVDDVLVHRLRMERHILQEIQQATGHMMAFESKMRTLIEERHPADSSGQTE
jgi:hypothetical protein